MRRFDDSRVAALFKAYPTGIRAKLMALRDLVFDVAAKTEGVGRLTETLKWGQPSYLTEETGSGTTVRIDRKRAAAEETVGLIAKEGGSAAAFEADASNSADVKAMVDACMAKWGRLDILDNNVGIGSTGGPVELSEDEWHKVFDVNVKSFFLTAKHVLPVMEKQGKGAIVNVSSIASIRSPKGVSYIAYNASKGAVNSLTLAIASQYADKGIRCNA